MGSISADTRFCR